MSWVDIVLVVLAFIVIALNLIFIWRVLKAIWGGVRAVLFFVIKRTPRFPKLRSFIKKQHNAWDWVVLPNETKEELQIIQSILRDPRGYKKRWGQEPPLGMILHGPPGTGKTLIARTLARDSGYHFLNVSNADAKDKFLGESERRIRELYRSAREAAPCIIFFDEIEGLASQRSQGYDPGGAGRAQNSLTNQLLQDIDGLSRSKGKVFTVGATNHLELLDDALLSRLSYQVYVGLPDTKARRQLFRLYTHPYKVRLNYPIAALVKASDGMSGRDIETVCNIAAMLAHGKAKDEVGFEEFKRAFARLGRTLPPFVEIAREACPACLGKDTNCPVCNGEGQLEMVRS